MNADTRTAAEREDAIRQKIGETFDALFDALEPLSDDSSVAAFQRAAKAIRQIADTLDPPQEY